jgi:L-aspartate oxidase
MWEDAGLVRDASGLGHAASVIAAWRRDARIPRTEAEFEDENLLVVAERVVAAALARRESIGAHYRRDDAAASVLSPVAAEVA